MINLARYRLDFEVKTPLRLPAFSGSTIRGAFGRALRASVCATKAKTCDGCPLLTSCSYAVVFEPRPPKTGHHLQNFSQIPRAYIIEPPLWGEKNYEVGEILSFHIVLVGRVVEQLPLILWAFHKGFQHGVGRNDGEANLVCVWHEVGSQAVPILESICIVSTVNPHEPTVAPAPTSANAVTLHFESPLRLQTNGRRATEEEFTPRKLLSALIRRIALISEFYGAGPLLLDFKALASQAEELGSYKQLKWRDWTRYSSRQQQKMDLGGVVGMWHLSGDLTPYLPFLHLGQWIHVGKEATFGLGGYRLELHK